LDCFFDSNEFAEDFEYFDPLVSKISMKSSIRGTGKTEKEFTQILKELQTTTPSELVKSV